MAENIERRWDGERLIAEASMEDFADWKATPAGVREAVLSFHVVGGSFGETDAAARPFLPTQAEVESAADMAFQAIQAGRLIDFGMLPNEALKRGGSRGGPLYQQGAFGHPFSDPWMFMHSWESGVAVYLVNPSVPRGQKPIGCETEVAELQPLTIKGNNVLLLSDRALIFHSPETPELFEGVAAPASWRAMPGVVDKLHPGMSMQQATIGNTVDPLMTVLMILNTRNVPRETITASEKLNKARVKSGKPRIPPYDRVDTTGYVTALLASRRERGEGQGGTHASPVFHLRMGHPRHYKTGRISFVAETLVNADPEIRKAFKEGRPITTERDYYQR